MKSLYKPILIVREDGYYKVRIIGFESQNELDKFIPSLQTFGFKDVWIPPVGKSAGKLIPLQPPVVEEAPVPTIALQVGIFNSKFLALRAQRRITAKLKAAGRNCIAVGLLSCYCNGILYQGRDLQILS